MMLVSRSRLVKLFQILLLLVCLTGVNTESQKDLYEVLEIKKDASQSEIKKVMIC